MSAFGLARADMAFRGVDIEYGSLKEAMLVSYFNHLRSKELKTSTACLKGEGASNIFESIKSTIFPELRIDKIEALKKNSNIMKKLRDKGIWVKPLG